MRTPLPVSAKPFARWGGRALSVARLSAHHTRISAKLSVEPRPVQRFALRFGQQCLAAARASQTHPFTQGVRLIFGTGAHGLIDAQHRVLAAPSISRVGLIGYVSLLPLEPLRAGYRLALTSIFGEALYEPRMLRALDRAVYWTTACACEASAVLGLGVRYFWMGCCVTAALPATLTLSLKAALFRDDNYEGLTFRGQPEAAPEQMHYLLQALRAGHDKIDAPDRDAAGFDAAVKTGLVSIESQVLSTEGQGTVVQPLRPTRIGPNEDDESVTLAKARVRALCGNDPQWAERTLALTRRATLEALVQTLSLSEQLFLHGKKGRFELVDGAGELRLSRRDENSILLGARVLFEAPHPIYARFGRKRLDLSFTQVRFKAEIIITRGLAEATPFTVQHVDFRITPLLTEIDP